MSYTLNLHNVICQLYLSKARKRNQPANKGWNHDWNPGLSFQSHALNRSLSHRWSWRLTMAPRLFGWCVRDWPHLPGGLNIPHSQVLSNFLLNCSPFYMILPVLHFRDFKIIKTNSYSTFWFCLPKKETTLVLNESELGKNKIILAVLNPS